MEHRVNLIIMCGIPASGKSTVAKLLNSNIVSTDSIRKELYGDESIQGNGREVFSLAYSRIRNYLSLGENVVFDATNIRKRDRKTVIDIGKEYNCDNIIICYCSTPLEIALERNANRERKVPVQVIKRMFNNFEEPSYAEGVNYICVF